MTDTDRPDDDLDLDLETWDHFTAAVRDLARGPRAGLTLAEAHREALQQWIGEMAASTTEGHAFQPAPLRDPATDDERR